MSNKLIISLCSVFLVGAASSAVAGNFNQTNPNSQLKSVLDSVQKSAMTFSSEVIEAENYSSQSGIRLGNTNDLGATQFVGWIDNNDFTEYTVTAPEAGTYELKARVASARSNATVGVFSNGSAAGSFSVAPTGGWEEWRTVSTSVNLPAGTQTIRLQYSGSGPGLMNINWFSLTIGEGESEGGGEPQTGNDRELDSSLWTLAANLNTADAYLAIDNDNSSRWTTREVQRSGQEFSIKLNSTENFDRLLLDSSRSNDDQPRRYEVAVSNDGAQWSNVATGTGDSNGLTVIDFADQSASFVRFRQLGSATRNWWSIHELKLFANSTAPVSPNPTPNPNPNPNPVGPSDCGFDELVECVENAANNGGGTIVLGAGTYRIKESVILQSNITIKGQGSSTIITFDDSVADTINEPLLHRSRSGNGIQNVTVEDLHLLCTVNTNDRNDRDRTDMLGFFIDGSGESIDPGSLQHQDITLRNVEVSSCGSIGIHVKGVSGLDVIDIYSHDNGWGTTDLWHNMYFLRVHNIRVIQTDPAVGGYKNSPSGHGLRMGSLNDVYFEGLVITGNADHGLHMNDVLNLRGNDLTIEGNCAIPNGLCRPVSCFGTCDYNLDANREN